MKKIQLMLLFFPAYSAFAQIGKCMHMCNDSSKTMSTYSSIGVSFPKFDGLNDRIKNYDQYRGMPDAMATLTLGSITEKGHFVGMNGLSVGYGMSGKRDEKRSSLGFLGLSADFGYNFLPKESRIKVYPTLGLGLEGYMASFNKDLSDVPFDTYISSEGVQNDTRPLRFTNCFITYRGGLNFTATSPDKSMGIGLQAGYTGSFNNREWGANGNQLMANAPKDNLSRFYASLVMTKKLNWGNKMH